ncbi:MAG: haloacid dehalogenase type II [Verrucomicrobia bacterium]|nr:haloacid dehalogenase type II [Verrucomicrobiota bacterium]
MPSLTAEGAGTLESTVRAVVFDTFGTVVDWRGSLINSLRNFGVERQMEVPWEKLVDRWRAAYQPNLNRVRRGELEWTILDELHYAALVELLPEFGIAPLPESDLRFLTGCWERLSGWPDAIQGLSRLRRKYIIGPLSNGNVSLLVKIAKFAELPWDVIFGADLFRHYKPDPETYLGVCSLLGLQPQQVMLGAAHNYDLAAAKELGLQTAFIVRPMEYGPEQTTDLSEEQRWDVIATDLVDLAAKLGT